jgi:hypothetical protein
MTETYWQALRVRNGHAGDREVWLEPWALSFRLKPEDALDVVYRPMAGSEVVFFDVVADEEKIVVTANPFLQALQGSVEIQGPGLHLRRGIEGEPDLFIQHGVASEL